MALYKNLLLFAFFGSISCLANDSHRPIDLKETIQYALENSPVFDTAKKTQSIRELEYKNAIAKLFPSFDFSTTNGLQNNITIATTSGLNPILTANSSAPWYSALSLRVSENIYDNGVSWTNSSIANLKSEYASIATLKVRDSLVLDVTSEFYRYSLAKILLDVRKQQLGTLEKQFKSLTNSYQQGLKTKSDYIRFKSQVQRAEIERITAENNIVQSEANLRKIIGKDTQALAFKPEKVDRSKKVFLLSPPLLEKVYDFRLAKIQSEINDKTVTFSKRNYWPQVSVISGISYLNQNYINSNSPFSEGQQITWNALLTLQYNIWDWGTRRRDIYIAEQNRDIQKNDLDQNLLDIQSKIIGLMADLTRIRQNYQLTQELLALEEEANQEMVAKYREGKVNYLDLVTELNNLLDAKVQFYSSYFDAITYEARHKYYEGRIYESN